MVFGLDAVVVGLGVVAISMMALSTMPLALVTLVLVVVDPKSAHLLICVHTQILTHACRRRKPLVSDLRRGAADPN